MKRVAVDIGGTFTDCFVVWGARSVQRKALTTHHNLALGFNEALDTACQELAVGREALLSEVDSVRYATTLRGDLPDRDDPAAIAIPYGVALAFGTTLAWFLEELPR